MTDPDDAGWPLPPVYECRRVLPLGRICGYVQRGPGVCSYDHPEPHTMVPYRPSCETCGRDMGEDECVDCARAWISGGERRHLDENYKPGSSPSDAKHD